MAKRKKVVKKKTVKEPKKETVEVETIETVETPVDDVKETSEAIEDMQTKLSETAEAATSEATEIPKGNVIESEILASENPATETANVATEVPTGENVNPDLTLAGAPRKNKPGAGRPSKNKTAKPDRSEYSETKPPEKRVDLIVAGVEGSILPILAHKKHKEYKDLLYSKEQKEILLSVQPETDFMKPSWPAYFITLVSFGMSNFFTAREDQQTIERKKLEAELLKQKSRIDTMEKNPMFQNSKTTVAV